LEQEFACDKRSGPNKPYRWFNRTQPREQEFEGVRISQLDFERLSSTSFWEEEFRGHHFEALLRTSFWAKDSHRLIFERRMVPHSPTFDGSRTVYGEVFEGWMGPATQQLLVGQNYSPSAYGMSGDVENDRSEDDREPTDDQIMTIGCHIRSFGDVKWDCSEQTKDVPELPDPLGEPPTIKQ
jgi:hypothetical protein